MGPGWGSGDPPAAPGARRGGTGSPLPSHGARRGGTETPSHTHLPVAPGRGAAGLGTPRTPSALPGARPAAETEQGRQRPRCPRARLGAVSQRGPALGQPPGLVLARMWQRVEERSPPLRPGKAREHRTAFETGLRCRTCGLLPPGRASPPR